MGMFWLAANATALRAGHLPGLLGSLGILQGLLFLATYAAALGRSPILVDISAGIGFLLVGPAWSFWFAWTLRRVVQTRNASQSLADGH
jgi:hypothetical protein